MANLLETIESGAARLESAGVTFGHGTECARDEAAALVLHALGLPLDGSGVDPSRELSRGESRAAERLLDRRIREARPAAYLIGETTFAGLRMKVDDRALVPRSPVAELIVDRFEPWVAGARLRRVLDLCTGGGCIAVATAVHLPHATVDAVDISAEALALASENVKLHGVDKRVRLIRSDLYQALGGGRYDLIVSNPPYVGHDAYDALPAEYRREPEIGLRAGRDGLEFALKILAGAPDHLTDGGILVCEVGDAWNELESVMPSIPFVWLEFRHGGHGVFLLEGEALAAAGAAASRILSGQNANREGA